MAVLNRIDAAFEGLRGLGRAGLMPFLTAGDPDLLTTEALVRAVIEGGAALVEIGIPYSDPIADGPVISASYTRALAAGVRLEGIWSMVARVRSGDLAGRLGTTPIVVMVSQSIVHRRGIERFIREAAAAGIDGLIVPDLPIEEGEGMRLATSAAGLKLIQLIAPTTPRDRAERIARESSGFLYIVSVSGITGERRELPAELASQIDWLREKTDLPLCVGFGVSGADQVRTLARMVDGVIVGSALVRRVAEMVDGGSDRESIAGALRVFVAELCAAAQRS